MAEKTLNTVIVLRNDSSTDWASSDYKLRAGELGVSYLDNGNVVVKAGDGVHTFAELKQVEGVFEQPVTLTQNFGYYNDVPAGSYKTYNDTVGMTTSEFLLSALKQTVEPTITQPTASLSASAPNSGASLEIGSYITKLNWNGSSNGGSYKIGNATQSTGLGASSFGWAVSNSIDTQTATTEDGSFTLTSDKQIQINSTTQATYATIDATVTIDTTNATTPKNNLGENTTGKITGFDTAGTKTKTLSAAVKATGYRNTWYYVGTDCTTAIDSAFIRSTTPKNATTTNFGTVTIPAGTKRVMFAVPGTHTLTSVIDVDGMGLDVKGNFNSTVVAVEGANGFTAANYTVFVAENSAGMAATKYTVSIS